MKKRYSEELGIGFHREADAACLFIQALDAPPVSRLADAGNQRKRTLEHANHLADRNVAGLSREDVTAAPAKLALEETVAGQFEQDRLEKFLRQALAIGKLRRLNRPLAGTFSGELQHCLEAVLRFLREHVISLADW